MRRYRRTLTRETVTGDACYGGHDRESINADRTNATPRHTSHPGRGTHIRRGQQPFDRRTKMRPGGKCDHHESPNAMSSQHSRHSRDAGSSIGLCDEPGPEQPPCSPPHRDRHSMLVGDTMALWGPAYDFALARCENRYGTTCNTRHLHLVVRNRSLSVFESTVQVSAGVSCPGIWVPGFSVTAERHSCQNQESIIDYCWHVGCGRHTYHGTLDSCMLVLTGLV